MRITQENWTSCFYKSLQLKAFISLGADIPQAEGQDPPLLYFVTLTNHDHEELFQREFNHLSKALEDINHRYGHWEFIDAENKGEGCSSCEAH